MGAACETVIIRLTDLVSESSSRRHLEPARANEKGPTQPLSVRQPLFNTPPQGYCSCYLGSLSDHLRADLLTQKVDGLQRAFGVEVPECPAIAGRQSLDMGCNLVDRA